MIFFFKDFLSFEELLNFFSFEIGLKELLIYIVWWEIIEGSCLRELYEFVFFKINEIVYW